MKRFFLTSLALLTLVGLLAGSAPQSSHVETHDYITLNLEPSASVLEIAPHYQDSRTFLSKVYEADHEFQLLGLNWEQELPKSTAAGVEVRFQSAKGEWTDWQEIETDQDGADSGEGFWTYIITDDAVAFQYRAQLSTEDTSVTPKIANVEFDYVDGGKQSVFNKLTKLVFDKNSSLVTREEWGANDEYLLARNYTWFEDDDSEVDDEEEEDPDLEIVRSVTEDEDGNELLWAQEYPKKVKKVIVHHTATTSDLDDPEQAIRAIYYYHAMSRAWGDIGYNYIIDADGNVYEGRAGGDGVVAGHTGGYNTGSVGIALLGDYEENPVTGEAMQSLTDLIYEKADLFDIDIDGASEFKGKMSDNLLGHRDLSATACPGQHVYELMQDIAFTVGKAQDVDGREVADEDFDYDDMTKLNLLTLNPQDSARIAIRLKNTGDETWDKNTFLTANANYSADSVVTIEKDSKKAIAYMNQSKVKPGGFANFTFDVESELADGLVHFDLVPVFNGTEKSTKEMDLGIYVEKPILDFDVVSTDEPDLMQPAQRAEVTAVIENTSNFTWTDSGDSKVELKRSGSSSLISAGVIAQMQEDEVEPGEKATFKFTIKAPSSAGKYSLYFKPEVEGYSLTTNSAGHIKVEVEGSDAEVLMIDTTEDLQFSAGEQKKLWIKVKNVGATSWATKGDDAFNLAFSGEKEMEVDNARMAVRTLNPNVSTKIYFDLTAPEKEGTYNLFLMPRLGNKDLLSEAFELEIEVGEADLLDTSNYENPIRIKLTPDNELSNVVLQSSGSFSVYDSDELVTTLSSSSFVRVTPNADGTYTISSGSYRNTLDGPVRVTANNEDDYIKVASMQQIAAWNSSINDNMFRGTVEVRMIDGKLTLINELPLEDYMRGIAEETNSTPVEKLKTMAVIARTYAYYYMTEDEKFAGMPYHLEDDPNSSQKYLGYGYELRHPNVVQAAEGTAGTIVTYKGKVVKTPYFSQSDGNYTKSAKSVWGWGHTPYLQAVSDKYCDADSFAGHGVGLSGCGAKGMAEDGFTFDEIIKYYYTGVELNSIQ